MSDLVSVIMPAYNAEKYIERSVASVIAQTYPHWELIVVDDGSTDNTAVTVHKMIRQDQRIKYVFQENKRLGAARNTGMRAAKGTLVAFLDSDDLWMENKLELQLVAIHETGADLVYTDGFMMIEETQKLEPYPTVHGFYLGTEMYRLLYTTNYIPVLSVCFKKEWINTAGYQDESLSIFGCEDLDFWLRLARQGASFFGMSQQLFKYRVHTNSMSQKQIQMNIALTTALSNNLDLSKVDVSIVDKRFRALILATVPDLMKSGDKNAASDQLSRAMRVRSNLSYLIIDATVRLGIRLPYRVYKLLLLGRL